jgi:hypothetical protein
MREFLRVLAAVSFMMFFFYVTTFIIYYIGQDSQQLALALEKYSVMVALRQYQKEHKAYPVLPDNAIGDLKKQLIDGGYLPAGLDFDREARYVSLDGKSYGLQFHVNRWPGNPRGTPCLVEVGTAGSGWWGAPKCPF